MNSNNNVESSIDYYDSLQPQQSNTLQELNNLEEYASQFAASMNGTFSRNNNNNIFMLQLLQQFTSQQQQQPNLYRATPASEQDQSAAEPFPYQQQAYPPALHEQSPSFNHNNNAMSSRSKLVVFVKVLLRYLDQVVNNEQLRQRTKQVIVECTRLHRNGALGYTSLSDALEFRLRSVIGDEHWNLTQLYCNYFIQRMEQSRNDKRASAAV